MSTLTASSLEILLARLDENPDAAAEKYETLRIKLAQLLKWRGCLDSHADDLADVALDRVAAKLASGEQVDNINAFAAGVARFIWLEHSRKNRMDAVGDDLPEIPIEPSLPEDPDERIKCLRRCVATKFNDDERQLVISYYDTDRDEKTKSARKRLAENLGLTMNALKVRACRLRMRLETCINDCVSRVTQSRHGDTQIQEAG
jgi:DNA-directed RNA polymerase specialized sigma24 family protein